jgi:phage/plasmid-like protein (TIGR03299 family)
MAHNLNFRNGKASMMYVDEVPWHGLGTPLREPATAKQAIEAASLDWEVVKRPLYVVAGNGLLPIKDKVAVVQRGQGKQSDTVFGVVSPSYTPLQNRDAFAFFDSIVGQKAAIYHTAGALGNGERVWILAKLPDTIHVAKKDDVDKYLLLSNSHDGRSAVQVKFTPIRVVCQNTLTMALDEGRTVRVQHHRNLEAGLEHAKEMLGIINARYAQIEEDFGAMAKVSMPSARLDEYLRLVFPDPAPVDETNAGYVAGPARLRRQRALTQARFNRKESGRLFVGGTGNNEPAIRGTLWAAYNGIAEMIDYRQEGMNPDRHLRSIWFGQGYHTKARAFEIAKQKLALWN